MKTPGQIAYEKYHSHKGALAWEMYGHKELWEDIAAAVLAAQWRPMSESPENQCTRVLAIGGGDPPFTAPYVNLLPSRTHWMPIPPLPTPPEPTPEEVERKEFEEWFTKYGYQASLNWTEAGESIQKLMLLGWQAARAAKEGKA